MSYFDSPKNKAMWNRRMAVLREEKERRRADGFAPQEKMQETIVKEAENNPFRRKINFEQLQEIEQKAMGAQRVRRPTRAAARQIERQAAETAEKKGMTR